MLKQIDLKARVFATLDFSSGYYQVPIKKEDGDLFAILLQRGKYRFCRTTQGSKLAGNIFIIASDPELREMA